MLTLDFFQFQHRKRNGGFIYKYCTDRLEISHHTELIDFFLFKFIDKLIRCMFDVLACSNCTPDNKNIGAGFQCIPDYVDPDTAGSRDKKFSSGSFLDCGNVTPCVGSVFGINCTVEFNDVRL